MAEEENNPEVEEAEIVDESEFEVKEIEDEDLLGSIPGEATISNKVKISFGKFIRLVASHSFLDIVEQNQDEEIIVSSNLLSDLANAHHQPEMKKVPVAFFVGIILGLVVAYLILAT